MPSVAAGMSTVLRSWQRRFKPGPDERALVLSVTNGTTRRLLRKMSEDSGFHLDEVPVDFPVAGEEALFEALDRTLKPTTALVVLDALPSVAPFALPLDEAARLCRERAPGAFVLADAAHGLLSVPLRLSGHHAAPIDALVAGCDAWLCGPRGTAVLHVAPEHHEWVEPLVALDDSGSKLPDSFYCQGHFDFSSWLALDEAMAFWDLVGTDPARIYCQYLALDAAEMLADAWGTGLGVPAELLGPMALVEVPRLPDQQSDGDALMDLHATAARRLLLQRGIDVPVKALSGRLYVRISAHIYNSIEDYEALRDAVLELRAGVQL
mmetsp:Transcript_149412/g.461236  ORF Transcript_149412/g.461236 Transcript_149412/m.461236 type:complete len:323 (+) Transcript_149412:452-1420(+)